MGSKKQKLECILRQSVSQAENAFRSSSSNLSSNSSSVTVLKAVHTFLTQWDSLDKEAIHTQQLHDNGEIKQARDLPHDYLRAVFCRLISSLDSVKNVGVVREQVLSTLRSLETAACRQVVMDFLPAIARSFAESNSHCSARGEKGAEKAKKQILSSLKEVFEKQPDSLSQILQFFSSILAEALPIKKIIFPGDIFHFIIEILPRVPENNLDIALRALISHINTTEDARLGVGSIRTELALLEKTDMSDMVHVAVALDEAVRGTNRNEELFVEEYFTVIEELINGGEKKHRSKCGGVRYVHEVEMQLNTFDLVMIIILRDSIRYHHRTLRLVSDGSMLESGLLSIAHISRLIELVDDDRACISNSKRNFHQFDSNPRQHFLESLVSFSMSFLLIPLDYVVQFDTKIFFSKAQDLLANVIFGLPKDFQTKAITMALRIVDELMTKSKIANTKSMGKDRLKGVDETNVYICLKIFSLLLSLVSRKKEILVPFQNHLMNYIMSESLDHLHETDLFQVLCSVVAKAVCNSNTNGQLNCITICRTLLFSTPRVGTITMLPQMQEMSQSRQIQGMIFANAVTSCCDLDPVFLVIVQKMVSRALLSPHSNACLLDPNIGFYGMKIVRNLQNQMKCDHFLRKDLFQMVSLILSHTRFVHYPGKSPKQCTTKTSSGFTNRDTPSFFPFNGRTVQRQTFRKMLLSFNSFFANEALLTQPSTWGRFSLWIFELIDTYLALGRTAKWNPRAWIFAGVEFPSIPSSNLLTIRKKEKLFLLMEHNFASLEKSQNSNMPISRMNDQIVQLIKGAKSISEKETIVDIASRFTLTLLLALSSSIAVLRNTYDHYKGLLEVEDGKKEGREKNEALQMIQYQFMKIHDFKQACQSMERLFRNLSSKNCKSLPNRSNKRKKRRLGKVSSTKEKTRIQMKAELVALYLRKASTKLVYSTELIPWQVFWTCLTDSSHDELLISSTKSLQHKETTKLISDVIRLRLNLMQHFATINSCAESTEHDGIQTILVESAPIFRRYITRCLRLTSFLLLNFQAFEGSMENNEWSESMVELVSEYVRLVCNILISKIEFEQASRTNDSDFFYILGLYVSVVGSKQPLEHTFEGLTISNSFAVEDFNFLINSFQNHFGERHTPITCQLLETLSVIAARSGSNVIKCMIDVHWSATFLSKYTNSPKRKDDAVFPYILVQLMKSLSSQNQKWCVDTASRERSSFQTITKLIKQRCSKPLDRHQHLVHSMFRHWGLLASLPTRIDLVADFLTKLFERLFEYLSDVDDCLVGHQFDSKENKEVSDDDDEYLPPSNSLSFVPRTSIPTSCNFLCLTSYSYPVFFDILVRMTVSSISLFSITEEMSSIKQPVTTCFRLHPVYILERMAIVYGSLVKLYKKKFNLFPKYLLSSVINSSKCMLDVSVTKSQEYIEWRNSQPVLVVEEGDARDVDLASTMYLKKLLDIFGMHVVGVLNTFCNEYSRSGAIKGDRTIQMPKSDQFFFGKVAVPGLRSLSSKIQRTLEFLSQTSIRHSMGEIKTDDIAQCCEEEGSTKDFRIEQQECLNGKKSSTVEDVSRRGVSGELKKETENSLDLSSIRKGDSTGVTHALTVEEKEMSYSEEDRHSIDDDGNSLSSRSDSFGVSGDWGQGIDSSYKEYDSELFIDQIEKST